MTGLHPTPLPNIQPIAKYEIHVWHLIPIQRQFSDTSHVRCSMKKVAKETFAFASVSEKSRFVPATVTHFGIITFTIIIFLICFQPEKRIGGGEKRTNRTQFQLVFGVFLAAKEPHIVCESVKNREKTLIVCTFFSPAFQTRLKEKDVKINKPGKQEK